MFTTRGIGRALSSLRSIDRRAARVFALAASAGALAIAPAAATADSSSLPSVSSGARPGPDLLYAPAPEAPQLENVPPWQAPPILVSGAEAYRDGEFLYQDYLFDDAGAAGTPDPGDPFNPVANLFSPRHGTIDYPTDPAFANNAADLVELRVKPLADATAFRVTLDTLQDPNRVAFTIALGDSPTEVAWPFDSGVTSPAQLFLTVHGTTAVLTNAATGQPLSPAPTASVDMRRRQIEARIPHSAWDPGTSTVRMAAGVGLWDPTANSYLRPGPSANATQPGGCATSCPAFFNMAFRLNEPVPHIYYPGIANTIVEGSVGVKEDGSWWRERRQADVLASGDVSEFSSEVDFAKLLAKVDDESAVPQTGHLDRIMASHFAFGQGADYNATCIPGNGGSECTGRYVGQLQPYALYVPTKPVPPAGYGLVISMHGLSANYNEFLGSHEAEQMGERGSGSILASPEGRGPDGSYKSYAEADVFEMWADVARHYRLNSDLTDVTGYSMGGGGTYRLATRWPDLFARAFPIVGPPTSAATFASLRNVPVLAWYGQNDELVGPEMSEEAFANALQAGIRYDHWIFTPAGHITEGNNDEYHPAAAFFGESTIDRNPPHVSYLLDPSQDPKALSPANHAYWLSGLSVRSSGSTGTIDVLSHGFGVGDPPVVGPTLGYGVLTGGSHGPIPYQERTLSWGPAPAIPRADELDVTATNIGSVTIDAARAQVDCAAKVNVNSDGPTVVRLADCPGGAAARVMRFAARCTGRAPAALTLRSPHAARVVDIRAFDNRRLIAHRRGRHLRALALPASAHGATLRVVTRLSNGRTIASRVADTACGRTTLRVRVATRSRRR